MLNTPSRDEDHEMQDTGSTSMQVPPPLPPQIHPLRQSLVTSTPSTTNTPQLQPVIQDPLRQDLTQESRALVPVRPPSGTRAPTALVVPNSRQREPQKGKRRHSQRKGTDSEDPGPSSPDKDRTAKIRLVGLDNEARAHLVKQEEVLLKLASVVKKMESDLNEADKRTRQLEIDLQEANVRLLQSEKRAAAAEGEAIRRVAEMEGALRKETHSKPTREGFPVSGSISYKQEGNKVIHPIQTQITEKEHQQPIEQTVPPLGVSSPTQDENCFIMLIFGKGAVRRHMNILLKIESDNNILTAAARREDLNAVQAFEDDQSELALEPSLQPLRPSWSNLRGAWNRALAYKFTAYMIHQVGQPAYLTAEIKGAFMDRLERLRRLIRVHECKEGETPEAMKQRVEKAQMDKAKQARVNTRRSNLNNSRLLIVEEERDDEEEKKAWQKIGDCVATLTAAGMSSDDSDGEDATRTVRKMPWRSPAISKLLMMVDADANRQGLFGAARPGNPGKPRKRRPTAGNSRRNAVPGLPINFYNDTWLDSLRNIQQAELDPQDEFDIPSLSVSHDA
ncbi:hypothetical protein H1R20_g987, partial [Candolleomyces eurysporus]